MNFLKTLKILRIKEKKSLMELTLFHQTLSFAADTSPVSYTHLTLPTNSRV